MAQPEYEMLAKELYKSIKDGLDGCTTEACKKARAEGEAMYQRVIEGKDDRAFKKLEDLDANIVKLLEGIEKSIQEEHECPNCGYEGDEESPVIGRCPEGHVECTKHDRELGSKKCVICGTDLEWD